MMRCNDCFVEFEEPDLKEDREPTEAWGVREVVVRMIEVCPHCDSCDIEEEINDDE